MTRRLLLLISILFSLQLGAQEINETNTDSLYFKALDYYKEARHQISLRYTEKGLKLAPEYHDIRILQVRNNWALDEFSKAGKDIEFLLSNAPEYPGVVQLAERHSRYIKDETRLLGFLQKLEKHSQLEPGLKVLKAQLLLKNGKRRESRSIALELFDHPKIGDDERYILQNILKRTISNEIGLNYQYITFSEDYNRGDWHTVSPEFQHNFGPHAVIARLNYVDRAYDDGLLYELEAYPVFSEKLYAMLNFGYSDGSLFPELRGSASIFINFLKKFEAEAGARLLHFSEKNHLTGIAGLTMYQGKFYLNLRAFIGPEKNDNLIQNYQFNLRYYFRDIDNYLFMRLGTGISPDERSIFTQVQENPQLEAYYGNMGFNKKLGNSHIIQLSAGYLFEDINTDRTGNQLIGNIGYRFRF